MYIKFWTKDIIILIRVSLELLLLFKNLQVNFGS